MALLAQRWSDLLLEFDHPQEGLLTRAARSSGSLLRPPASEADVIAAEQRLGCWLPPSYRRFLAVSNGAYGDLYGPSRSTAGTEDQAEVPLPGSATPGIGFLPVQEVGWLRDVDPQLAGLYAVAGSPGGPGRPASRDGEEPRSWVPFADGLVIATDKQPGTTCLVPFPGQLEWQVWNIHKETAVAYLSFESLLIAMVADREPVTTLDEVITDPEL